MHDWYKRAILYEVLLPYFKDDSGNGTGDFAGLTRTLDYLTDLGITCLWLPPFYASPWRDNGYDISDYYQVNERFGSQGDFARFLEHARERGLHVIVDMVFNHTSVDHPWFQAARQSEDSPYRDYYIWADEPVQREGDHNVIGVDRVWTFDERAQQHYHHTFYPHQPDLDLTNERVRQEIRKILGYWLQLGVSGFRIDAVPHMLRPKGHQQFEGDPYEVLNDLRAFVTSKDRDAVLLGEVDVQPDEYATYFGNDDRLNMLLNFYACNYLFLALATQSARPIEEALDALPNAPKVGVYANFLRNHDELDLEKLPKEDRQKALDAFAPEQGMRLFGRGARRRLAPMLGGDGPRLRLALSLLLALPGVPVLYYGDEIGMGDDLELDGRKAVRTPMQWSDRTNAGFSRADPDELIHPVISGGEFGYERVNAAAQRREPDSLLNWVTRAIRARHACPEFGLCECEVLDAADGRVLAHVAEHDGGFALAVHNLSESGVEVELEALARHEGWIEVFADAAYERPEGGRVKLNGFGFRWFRADEFYREQPGRSRSEAHR